jgi:hypothetical protein
MFIHKLDTAIFAMYSSIPQSSDNVIYPRHCSLILHIQDECFFPFSLHLCCTLCLNRPTTISTPDVNASADSVSAGVSSRRTVSAFNNSTVHFLFMCIAITVQKPQPFLYGVIP